jgi:DNA-binding NarL/FixJ family response regulator
MSGVLVVTRAAELHTKYKVVLEKQCFQDVTITDKENYALNTVICNKKPRLVFIDCWFYQDATPCRIGELVKLFPKLNIAVFSVHDFPSSRAVDFIWEGANSYLSLWDGYDEFQLGLRILREGGHYISPKVQELIDLYPERPEIINKETKRLKECLIMLCCGCSIEQIGKALYISKSTVYKHLNRLYSAYHARSRAEMTTLAWETGLVTPNDTRLYDKGKKRYLNGRR